MRGVPTCPWLRLLCGFAIAYWLAHLLHRKPAAGCGQSHNQDMRLELPRLLGRDFEPEIHTGRRCFGESAHWDLVGSVRTVASQIRLRLAAAREQVA
jgi:hypothetical protein